MTYEERFLEFHEQFASANYRRDDSYYRNNLDENSSLIEFIRAVILGNLKKASELKDKAQQQWNAFLGIYALIKQYKGETYTSHMEVNITNNAVKVRNSKSMFFYIENSTTRPIIPSLEIRIGDKKPFYSETPFGKLWMSRLFRDYKAIIIKHPINKSV